MSVDTLNRPTAPGTPAGRATVARTLLSTRTLVIAGSLALAALVAVQAFVVRPALDAGDSSGADAVTAVAPPADAAGPVELAVPIADEQSQVADDDAAAEPAATEAPAPTPSATPAPSPTPTGTPGDLMAGLPPLTFLPDSDELAPGNELTLAALAALIRAAPEDQRFAITAWTDSSGDVDTDMWLSGAQAAAVCNAMRQYDLPRSKFDRIGAQPTEVGSAGDAGVQVVPAG